MTDETKKILDDMIAKMNKSNLQRNSFYMHHSLKESKNIPDNYKGIDVFVSGLMPVDAIYLTHDKPFADL